MQPCCKIDDVGIVVEFVLSKPCCVLLYTYYYIYLCIEYMYVPSYFYRIIYYAIIKLYIPTYFPIKC